MTSVSDFFPSVGLDIGGANIKIAFSETNLNSIPFPLWKQPDRLTEQLAEIFQSLPTVCSLAITMTGELADCFANRKLGVEFIVTAAVTAAGQRAVKFYAIPKQVDVAGEVKVKSSAADQPPSKSWLDAEQANQSWSRVAAANWHAIAQFASRYLPDGSGFLIDIGSTTTDIVPIRSGQVIAQGLTDFERLSRGELFYGGVARTPICSLCSSFQIGGATISVAREFFATIEDAFLVLGNIPADPGNLRTPDGRPATQIFAAQRLAKMVGNDARNEHAAHVAAESLLSSDDVREIASQSVAALTNGIRQSLQTVIESNQKLPLQFVISGQGDWLAKQVVEHYHGDQASVIMLADILSPAVSRSAAAFAVAKLAAEELPTPANPAQVNSANVIREIVDPTNLQTRVIKLGGSLLAWDQFPQAIGKWLNEQPVCQNIWIVGGGSLVDTIRDWDRRFSLDEAAAHWLCLDLMSINARLVASHFPAWLFLDQWPASINNNRPNNYLLDTSRWLRGQMATHPFRLDRNQSEGTRSEQNLPETWSVTSDSCAAFFASTISPSELVLLKSCDAPDPLDLKAWVKSGFVDQEFSSVASSIPAVRAVNLRKWF